jgi:hypothetical protein
MLLYNQGVIDRILASGRDRDRPAFASVILGLCKGKIQTTSTSYRETAMPKKNFIPLFLLLAVLFILYGDSLTFLPQPVRNASLASRNFAAGLWPKWLRPKDVNEQRERDIEKLQKSPSSSQ